MLFAAGFGALQLAKYWNLGVFMSSVPAFIGDKTIRRHSKLMEPAEYQGLMRSTTEVLVSTKTSYPLQQSRICQQPAEAFEFVFAHKS